MTSPVSPLTRRLLLAWLPAGLGLIACEDKIIVQAPTAPTPPTAPIPDRIEFRVLGTHRSVTIRHVNAQDGTTIVRSDLPYFASFTTIRDSMFLSLEAFATGDGFLQVQLWINGYLLQEATSSDSDPRLNVTVNYRRGQYPPPVPVPV